MKGSSHAPEYLSRLLNQNSLDMQRGVAVIVVLFLEIVLKNTLRGSELQSYLYWNKRQTLSDIAPFQTSSSDVRILHLQSEFEDSGLP